MRELENAIERAVNLADSSRLRAEDILPEDWNDEPPSEMPMESAPPPGGGNSGTATSALKLVDIEKHAILEALRRTGGSRRQAARILGIGEATLYRKLKDYGTHAAEA